MSDCPRCWHGGDLHADHCGKPPPPSDDLIEDLRGLAEAFEYEGRYSTSGTMKSAADKIEQLRAENERLKDIEIERLRAKLLAALDSDTIVSPKAQATGRYKLVPVEDEGDDR